MAFHKIETHIPDVWIIKPDVFRDSRGFFLELFNRKSFDALGLAQEFVQDNLSQSGYGTIRGIHFQRPPFSQGKLITVLQGAVLDVAVDLRSGSPTYGEHVSLEISSDDPTYIFIPEGFGHGFQVLSETCLFFYKCTHFYDKASDGGIAWNDPKLNLPWRDLEPIISEKDKKLPKFEEFETPF